MKTTAPAALLLLFLRPALAQYNGLPTCAQSCAASALSSLNCGLSASCICGSGDFIKGITCCVACACDDSDQSAVLSYAKSICEANSVTTLPTAIACTTSYSCTKSPTLASNTATHSKITAASTTATSVSTSTSSAGLPRQTAANVGMGIVGGLAAAVVFL